MQSPIDLVVGNHVVLYCTTGIVSNQNSNSAAISRAQVNDYIVADFPTTASPVRHRLNRVEEGTLCNRNIVDPISIHNGQIRCESQVADGTAIASPQESKSLAKTSRMQWPLVYDSTAYALDLDWLGDLGAGEFARTHQDRVPICRTSNRKSDCFKVSRHVPLCCRCPSCENQERGYAYCKHHQFLSHDILLSEKLKISLPPYLPADSPSPPFSRNNKAG